MVTPPCKTTSPMPANWVAPLSEPVMAVKLNQSSKLIKIKKLQAEEAGEILRVIEEKRKKEEKIVRKKSARIKDIKTNLKKYGLSDKKISPEDLTNKPINLVTEGIEVDLDQEKQEPSEEELEETYNKIKRLITQRKISRFINEAAEEKLVHEQKKIKDNFKKQLIADYQDATQDEELNKELTD
ncbi:9091_t:CDS:2 [Ambispora gerdemannii]|uniref:9091_t:CDS:1 n=1 Tax=Ambispora gerdemannii TaxID=144530 RepID=A0A9N8YQN3_9GLOM|nr:9091_t:CDS:2 [Ambispora gerdemannii]